MIHCAAVPIPDRKLDSDISTMPRRIRMSAHRVGTTAQIEARFRSNIGTMPLDGASIIVWIWCIPPGLGWVALEKEMLLEAHPSAAETMGSLTEAVPFAGQLGRLAPGLT